MQGVKFCHSQQHYVKVWAGGWGGVESRTASLSLPPHALYYLSKPSYLHHTYLGQGVQRAYTVQDKACNRDAQTEVCKKPGSWSPAEWTGKPLPVQLP